MPMRVALLLPLALVAWLASQALAHRVNQERDSWPRTESYVVLPPARLAPILSLGYRELWADITWCRGLVYYGSSLTGETDLRYLETFIDNIIALDPQFKRVYRWAAYAVTFKESGKKVNVQAATQAEFESSVRYLERGIEAFPDGYELYWLAGLRYWLDLRPDDPVLRQHYKERGAELVEEAMRKKDAPKDLATLAASLRTKLGQKRRALRDLKEMVLSTDDEEARKKLLQRVGYLASTDVMDELAAARTAFDQAWQANLPAAPPDLMVILGPRPSRQIDFRKLAADRDLFGAEEDPTELWKR
jgi:hypothetical protein